MRLLTMATFLVVGVLGIGQVATVFAEKPEEKPATKPVEKPAPSVELMKAELAALRAANEQLATQVQLLQKTIELQAKTASAARIYQAQASAAAERTCKPNQSWSVQGGEVTCQDPPNGATAKK